LLARVGTTRGDLVAQPGVTAEVRGQPVVQRESLVEREREEPLRDFGELGDLARRGAVVGELEEPHLVQRGAQVVEEGGCERAARRAGRVEAQNRDHTVHSPTWASTAQARGVRTPAAAGVRAPRSRCGQNLPMTEVPTPSPAMLRKWRRRLADERAESRVYRDLATRRTGEEHDILTGLANAEERHAAHWAGLLGSGAGDVGRGATRWRMLAFLARRFGSVFVLALAQRAETRSPYDADADATPRWRPTSASTRRWCVGSRRAVGPRCRARSGRRSSAPTTAWSATSRWCSA